MDHNDDLWVERRLASLDPPAAWQPDAEGGFARMRRLDRMHAADRRKRWFAGLAAAAACVVAAVVLSPRSSDVGFVPHAVTPASFRETGRADAPVVAEIYTDYQCGHCAALYIDTVPQLKHDFVDTGRLRLVHRDLPLPQHRYAREAARYANAAGSVGRYDLAVDQLFRTQGDWAKDGDVDGRLASVLGAGDMRRVREAVRDGDSSIDADVEMARADDVRETPTIVVVAHGKRRTIAPVPPYPLLKSYLDEVIRSNCREDPKATRC